MRKKKLAPGILKIQFLILISYSTITLLTLLSLFFEHLGGSPRQIGFLMGLFAFAAFLSRPFAGWLLSQFNNRGVMIAGLTLMLVVTSLHPFIQELNWFVVLIRILHGLGFSVFIQAALLITINLVHEEARAYALGVVSTGFILPVLVFPFLGEEIIRRFGFFAFFLSAIFLSVIPFVYSLFIKLNIPGFSEDSEAKSVGFLAPLKQKKINLILFLTVVFEIGLSSCLAFVPLLAIGESPLRAGYYYTFLALSAVFVRVIGGSQLRFWGSPKLLLPAFCLISGGGLLISLSSSNGVLGISGVIYGIGIGILYPHLSALIVKGITSRERAKVLSLFASSVDLGFALGPLFFGWIYQSIGIRPSFALISAFIFLSSTGIILLGRSSLFPKLK
jgi:MFS family permease